MLKIILPPNLEAAAARDAVAVRLDWNPGNGPIDAAMPALAVIQRLAPGPEVPRFVQLTRAQLRLLIEASAGQSFVYLATQPTEPLAWSDGKLPGVTEHLASSPPPAPVSGRSPLAGDSEEISPARRILSQRPVVSRDSREKTQSGIADTVQQTPPPQIDGSEHFLAITLPSRGHHAYNDLLELLKGQGFTLETSNRRWWLRDRHKTLAFLGEHWTALKDWGAEFTENFQHNTARLGRAEIVTEARAAGEDFDVTLELRAGDADPTEVYAQVSAGRSFVESRGRVYLVERSTRERLAGAQHSLAGDPSRPLMHRSTHRVPRHRVAEVGEILDAMSPNFRPPAEWLAGATALRNHSRLAMPMLAPDVAKTLRDYQRLGAAWLHHLHTQRLGGVLADEMGLGKTLQALAMLSTLHGASLVVCPAALVENWRREAARFVPSMRVRVHHGADRGDPSEFAGVDLVVTSYGTLVRDRALFERVEFECLVADEAQHVKNRRTQNAAALRGIRARSRLMLSGTPVENSLDDLRSIFEIALPGAIKPIPTDTRGEDRRWHEGHLRRQTAPFILRRTKAQVASELPPKIEQTIHCEAGPAQRAFYENVRASTEGEIEKLEFSGGKEAQVRLAVLTQLLRLRQVCCDPALLPGGAEIGSAKMDAFLELLDEAVDDGHRMLVFSQFTSLLRLVRDELETRALPFASIDGSMNPKARQNEVDRFQGSPDIPVFLISLKAGGTGLNLTGADTVVHFDPWWNPAVEAQATDRAHRIGQTRTVNVYKLIVAGTVEEKVLALQQDKARLLADVFDESDAANARLSLAELRELGRGTGS